MEHHRNTCPLCVYCKVDKKAWHLFIIIPHAASNEQIYALTFYWLNQGFSMIRN